MWRRRVGGALESGGRLRTERLEVFDWAGHKRCASWFLLEGLLSYRWLGLSRGVGFKKGLWWWSGEWCVGCVGGWCSGGGSRAQSQAEKVKVGAVAFLAPAQGDIIGCRAFSLHVTLHLHNTAFLGTFIYNDILASLSIEYDPYEYDRIGDCRVTGARSLQATPKGSTSPKDCVRRHCRKACGDHWVHLFTVFVHVTSRAEGDSKMTGFLLPSRQVAIEEMHTPDVEHSRHKSVYLIDCTTSARNAPLHLL
jgi:hypothetical protein